MGIVENIFYRDFIFSERFFRFSEVYLSGKRSPSRYSLTVLSSKAKNSSLVIFFAFWLCPKIFQFFFFFFVVETGLVFDCQQSHK